MAINYIELVEQGLSDGRELVIVSIEGAVATVTLNDPDTYNSLSPALCVQLNRALRSLDEQPRVKVVILTGAGRAFSSGGNMALIHSGRRALQEGDEGAVAMWRWIRQQFGGVARWLMQSDKYCIAAVNGPAAGVGLAWAFACDHIVLARQAQLSLAFFDIGLVPEVGMSWFLTRQLGYHRAMALLVENKPVTSTEAKPMGLVNQVVDGKDLDAAVKQWATQALSLQRHAIPMTKNLLRRATDATWEQSIALEEYAEPIAFTTPSHQQVVESFLNRKG